MNARWRTILIAALGAGLSLPGRALAADSSEFWPQASAFVGLDEGTRLYFDGSFARGKESTLRTLDLSAFVDLSIQPILRQDLRTDDWQRARYLWARLGYTHVGKVDEGKGETTENRGVLSIYAKAPLPAEVWIEGRARVDLRWLGDEFSTRYRLRFDVTREFTLLEHVVVPYVNGEAFYDTRYDGISRLLYQIGTEVTVSKGFRYEIYLGWLEDRLPSASTLLALGAVAKWYF